MTISGRDIIIGNLTLTIAGAISTLVDNGGGVQVAIPYLLIVLCCNIIKILSMAMTLWLNRTDLLVTTGDALQSYLQQPEMETYGYCLLFDNAICQAMNQQKEKERSCEQPYTKDGRLERRRRNRQRSRSSLPMDVKYRSKQECIQLT